MHEDGATGNDDSRWIDGNGIRMPEPAAGSDADAVIESDMVVIASNWVLTRHVTVAHGGVAVSDNAELQLNGDFRIGADGTYVSEVNASQNGQISVAGEAYLNGTFEVMLVDGYTVEDVQALGGSATIVDSRRVIEGDIVPFDPEEGKAFASLPQFLGLDMFVSGEAQQGNVHVDAEFLRALGGDTDGDRDVDFDDFNMLAGNFTGTLPPGTGGKDWSQGDFDFDQDVDFDDFNILAANFTGTGGDYTQGGAAAGGGGGGGGSALIREMLARKYTPLAWLYDYWLARVYQSQPDWLAEVEQILAEDQSSNKSYSAQAADKLLELLATYWV